MSLKKFLVPVSAALAALIPPELQALPVSKGDVSSSAGEIRISGSIQAPVNDAPIRTIEYMIQSEVHSLLLRQSENGTLYAGHGSHASHGSHQSHASHASHGSGGRF
jgi:hypothetical protein